MIGSQLGQLSAGDMLPVQEPAVVGSNQTIAGACPTNPPEDLTLRTALTMQIKHLEMQAGELRLRVETLSPEMLDTKLSIFRGLPLWM